MYNNINPAELYAGTTWELLSSDKYIKTGSSPLSTGGSNTVSITKANLPNVKLKIDSHSHTQPTHTHGVYYDIQMAGGDTPDVEHNGGGKRYLMQSESAGGENTGTASPNTETLGTGTPLNIQPAYITLEFWKRLT